MALFAELRLVDARYLGKLGLSQLPVLTFSIGYTLAEALNFADSTWTADLPGACAPTCPDHPIPIEHLAFLGPGESQRRIGDLEEERSLLR